MINYIKSVLSHSLLSLYIIDVVVVLSILILISALSQFQRLMKPKHLTHDFSRINSSFQRQLSKSLCSFKTVSWYSV